MNGLKKQAKTKKKKPSTTFGITEMVNGVHEALLGNPNVPASARGLSKVAIKAVIETQHDLTMGAVADGNKVAFLGYGSFEPRERAERKGRNPQTGEEITIEARVVPAFKPGKNFRDGVAGFDTGEEQA